MVWIWLTILLQNEAVIGDESSSLPTQSPHIPIVEDVAKSLNLDNPDQNKVLEEDDFILGGSLEFPTYSFYLGSPNVQNVAYVPNFAPRFGPRIIYRKVGFKIGLNLPLPAEEIERRGNSQQSNFIVSFYLRKFAFDIYYQYYSGFYIASPLTELNFNKPQRYSQLPNAESMHWGINWYYNVSATTFSLGSAFDQVERKLSDGEAWILIPFYRHWKIDLGDRIIKGSHSDSVDRIPPLRAGRFDTFGGAIGYAKLWTYESSIYFSILGAIGPALQNQNYIENSSEMQRLTWAGKINGNASVGFHRPSYMLGASAKLDSIYSQISGEEVYSTLVSLEVSLSIPL